MKGDMYSITFSPTAKKHLEKIDRRYLHLIGKAIDSLKQNPFVGIPLSGELKGRYKLRVSHFRIVYRVLSSELFIFIFDINHRKDIYRP